MTNATLLRSLDSKEVLRLLTLLFRNVEHESKFTDVFIDASSFNANKNMVTALVVIGYLNCRKGTHLAFTERGFSYFVLLWNNKNNNESITQKT